MKKLCLFMVLCLSLSSCAVTFGTKRKESPLNRAETSEIFCFPCLSLFWIAWENYVGFGYDEESKLKFLFKHFQ